MTWSTKKTNGHYALVRDGDELGYMVVHQTAAVICSLLNAVERVGAGKLTAESEPESKHQTILQDLDRLAVQLNDLRAWRDENDKGLYGLIDFRKWVQEKLEKHEDGFRQWTGHIERLEKLINNVLADSIDKRGELSERLDKLERWQMDITRDDTPALPEVNVVLPNPDCPKCKGKGEVIKVDEETGYTHTYGTICECIRPKPEPVARETGPVMHCVQCDMTVEATKIGEVLYCGCCGMRFGAPEPDKVAKNGTVCEELRCWQCNGPLAEPGYCDACGAANGM